MKTSFLIAGIFLLIIFGIFLFFRMQEDSWIIDSRGVWVKHGNPSETPNYIFEQQQIISCASSLFNNFTQEKNSQCLGTCGDYAIDLVHVPRTNEDNLVSNQCPAFLDKEVNHFLELDGNGSIIRIA